MTKKHKPIVMVTGATGYIGSTLVSLLVEQGYTVHAPVRNPEDNLKIGFLQKLAEQSHGNIKFFKADLLKPLSYQKAMQGCQYVFHVASPVKFQVTDALNELVKPALEGTQNILQTVDACDSVERVVLTSSVAAIYADNIDIENTKNGVFTEQKWNTFASIEHNPYGYSKTIAEKAAWRIHTLQARKASRWRLVVINPSVVIGPSVNPAIECESFNLIKRMADGTCRFGAPRWGCGVVDVRDLAIAQLNAIIKEDVVGRYIVSGHNTDFYDLAQLLRQRYGSQYPFPKWPVPKWLLKNIGPRLDKNLTRQTVERNVNLPWFADNQKSKQFLKMQYRPLTTSLFDMFDQMIAINYRNL